MVSDWILFWKIVYSLYIMASLLSREGAFCWKGLSDLRRLRLDEHLTIILPSMKWCGVASKCSPALVVMRPCLCTSGSKWTTLSPEACDILVNNWGAPFAKMYVLHIYIKKQKKKTPRKSEVECASLRGVGAAAALRPFSTVCVYSIYKRSVGWKGQISPAWSNLEQTLRTREGAWVHINWDPLDQVLMPWWCCPLASKRGIYFLLKATAYVFQPARVLCVCIPFWNGHLMQVNY